MELKFEVYIHIALLDLIVTKGRLGEVRGERLTEIMGGRLSEVCYLYAHMVPMPHLESKLDS